MRYLSFILFFILTNIFAQNKKEYFKGIGNLKRAKLSDITLYRLNMKNSPYHKNTDLVEIKMFLKDYNAKFLQNRKTTEFIDYAILINRSKNQIPIEETE